MTEPTGTHLILSKWSYDSAKRLVQVILPAVSSLYFGLGQIWGFPAIEQVVGSIAVITTFLGVVLGVSSKNFYETRNVNMGKMFVSRLPGGKVRYSLEVNGPTDEIEQYSSLTFEVVKTETPTE